MSKKYDMLLIRSVGDVAYASFESVTTGKRTDNIKLDASMDMAITNITMMYKIHTRFSTGNICVTRLTKGKSVKKLLRTMNMQSWVSDSKATMHITGE